jgi:hypothetical protein
MATIDLDWPAQLRSEMGSTPPGHEAGKFGASPTPQRFDRKLGRRLRTNWLRLIRLRCT